MKYDVCSMPNFPGSCCWRVFPPGKGIEAASPKEAIVKSGLVESSDADVIENAWRVDGTEARPYRTPSSLIFVLPYVEWDVEIGYIDRKISNEMRKHTERVVSSNKVNAEAVAIDVAAEKVPWDELLYADAKKVINHATQTDPVPA